MPAKYRTVLTQVSCGQSAIFVPDTAIRPFAIGVGLVATSTGMTFGVEHTFDYTGSSAFVASQATWFPHTSLTGISCSRDGNYAFPVSAIRLTVAASGGTVVGTFMQAG